MQMHPPLQQHRDVLGALMIRPHASLEEFARLGNLVMPEKRVRFQVMSKGSKAYHIVDLVTGKTHAFRWSYKSAVDIAIQFEEKAGREI